MQITKIVKIVMLALLATAARADNIHILSSDSNLTNLSVTGGALTYLGSFSAVGFNNNQAFCFDPCNADATTGTLIGKLGSDTWIFGAGGDVHVGGLTSSGLPPGTIPPPGFPSDPSACLDVGFDINVFGGLPCSISAGVQGQFIGNVTVTISDLVEMFPGFFTGAVHITGPIDFDITQQLGLALGIAPGEYSGTYEASSKFLSTDQLPADDLAGFFADIRGGTQELAGTAVPEPSALLLLLSAVLATGYALRNRRIPDRS